MKQINIVLVVIIAVLIGYIAVSHYINPYTTALDIVDAVANFISPELHKSAKKYMNAKGYELARRLDVQSLKSEAEQGVYAIIEVDSTVCTERLDRIGKVYRGMKVLVVDLKGIPANDAHEGLTHIMLPNVNGDFVDGLTGYVPTRSVRFL